MARVRLTNADKVLYPAAGTTKADVFDYYTRIAEVMVPHVAGRPVTRKRWPNGVEEESFFEKQLASSAPDWLPRATMRHRSGDTTYPLIEDVDGLAWIAQQAALEVHVPQWRFVADEEGTLRPGPTTRLVFDLDPGSGVGLADLAETACAIKDLVDDISVETFPLTSGSKGLHLYAQLDRPVHSDSAVLLARTVARRLEEQMPDRVTTNMKRSLRAGKVFVDWSQNNAAKTTIAPYSLRGRRLPTVAAPRTWAELADPELRQLRYEEVLDRVERDGDLLATLDPMPEHGGAPEREATTGRDRLSEYRRRRNPAKTPEPVTPEPVTPEPVAPTVPGSAPGSATPTTVPSTGIFVIQEHHARRLHYDFRLEHDGVLVSWAVPKNLPDEPSVNHLAVRTEDHPLEYASFEGTIPRGEYGAGTVSIWDTGGYRAEEFGDDKVIVTLHGGRVSGRYALIRTDGNRWLAHRTKDQPAQDRSARGQSARSPSTANAPDRDPFTDLSPMLPKPGTVTRLPASQWAFEGKWDGYRVLVEADRGVMRLRSRNGRDVTGEYPQLRSVVADLADHHAILDGELVGLDDAATPSFAEMQNHAHSQRIEFWAFDLLRLDGRSLRRARYRDRRRLLELLADDTGLVVPPLLGGDGGEAMTESLDRGWEGVVAKRWASTYQPGHRSSSWIKEKHWHTQEVVIGGWFAGEGGRSGGIGSLLMGIPSERGLRFVGRVGTGFTQRTLAALKDELTPLRTDRSPFDTALPHEVAAGAVYIRPVLVGEVRYHEHTQDGRLRHPSWRGLRPDKTPSEVREE